MQTPYVVKAKFTPNNEVDLKSKNVTLLLQNAVSLTDCDEIVTKWLEQNSKKGTEFTNSNANKKNIEINISDNDTGDFFEVKVQTQTEFDNGKIKKHTILHLLQSDNISDIPEKIKKIYSHVIVEWKITGINLSNIYEII